MIDPVYVSCSMARGFLDLFNLTGRESTSGAEVQAVGPRSLCVWFARDELAAVLFPEEVPA